ncbi:mfs monosaccharide transporter protein [Penicillium maclennaniae]|uniref:mfs monosaccharide transporter protein n=1 Tax=Penicillium maclennaniae TaxID=1343394 RepID=UPI0025404F04|nr:mfs monosaccharide transporter protein [Penicillium maclennaniae]KAJ5665550.1 mfs monosaccharide transporter protein [Penicillium maclennaniae]
MDAPTTAAGNKLQPQNATWRMLLLSIWVSFAAWISAFDSGYGGIVLIMPSFQKRFGHCDQTPHSSPENAEKCTLTTLQQSLLSVSFLFTGIGSALAGINGSSLGRKRTIQVACLFCIIGAAGMLGTSGNFLQYMVCKCINGVGNGQLLAASIVYGSECVSANKRGLLLGIFNVGLAMGNVAAAAVCAGSATLAPDNDWQWKAPIVSQIPLSLLLGCGILMFPESPRWLLLKGKEYEARKAFATYQGLGLHSAEITAQVEDVQRSLEFEQSVDASTSWIEIYRGSHLRRTAVSSLILIGLAITGIQFVAPYAALFFSGVGIKNPFLINVIVGLCIFGGACIGPMILEYGGRRFAMLSGYSVMAICMLILSTVSTALGSDDPAAQKVVIAFLCIWAFVFGGFIGPSVWLASAEMHSVRLRTYGQANTTLLYEIFSFAVQFWTPYMLNVKYGNMGVNVGYFYFGLTVAVLVLVFFFVPETARLTLEQIDDFFLSGNMAWKTSTRKNIAIARGNPLGSSNSTLETFMFAKEAAHTEGMEVSLR